MSTSRPRFRLTERDIAIFESLSTARFLTAQAIEWLHFPDWRRRWRERDQSAPYYPTPRVYGRLRQLEHERLIYRFVRPVSLVTLTPHRDDNAYALSKHGAALLAEARGVSIDEVWYEEPRERSFNNLTHSILIGVLYAALRAKIESMEDITLHDWRGDHILARGLYDVVNVPGEPNRRRIDRKWPILSDATCLIRHPHGALRCFVELDRGRPVKTWGEKIIAYREYAASPELRARYDTSNFVLLAATTTTGYRRRLMTATAEALGQASDRYLFTLIRDLHPDTIGVWSKIGGVTTTQTAGIGVTRTLYSIEEKEHVLLR